ncbi:hypothetical protein [Vibrio navarrensis]|uniref:hypothetical protein n=1 Tax=Vibrio navarrensis TaxID=29495 RepID=UPI00130233A6|nr:hypothetical protein [Vibrio navarrensis]
MSKQNKIKFDCKWVFSTAVILASIFIEIILLGQSIWGEMQLKEGFLGLVLYVAAIGCLALADKNEARGFYNSLVIIGGFAGAASFFGLYNMDKASDYSISAFASLSLGLLFHLGRKILS